MAASAAAAAAAAAAAGQVLRRTASTVVCKPATGSHVLKIDGYSHLSRLLGNGDHVRSSPFTVAGHAWRLRLYPNGDDEEDDAAEAGRHIAVYVHLDGYPATGQHVRAHPRFSVLDRLGTPAITVDAGVSGILRGGCGRGNPRFISREALEESGHIKDDCFAIQCDVTVMSNSTMSDEA